MFDFDHSKLRGRIRESFNTETNFATALGVSKATLSAKLNSKIEFTQEEIAKSVNLLGINENEIAIFFLRKKSNKFDA